MTAVLVGRYEPGTAEWQAARANGIGGSEIAAVLGLSPFESRFSLWHRKAGVVEPVEETPLMEWGKRLEPAIAQKFIEEHPEYAPVIGGIYRHVDRPWQLASPDLLLAPACSCPDVIHECGDPVAEALLEVKTSPFGDGWGDTGTTEIPIHVRVQVLWYLDTLDLRTGHVAVLIGGRDYREYTIRRNEVECAQLRQAARDFLDDLANGVRPDIDDHSATYETIRELHPDIDPAEIELDTALVERFVTAKAASDAADAAWTEARSRVADAMGDARKATWAGITIATRQARNGGRPYVVAGRNLPDTTEFAA